MPVPHLEIRIVQRSKGSSAVAGYADRVTLWNAAEEVEKQWNSQLARGFVVALPREAPTEMYSQMMQEYFAQSSHSAS